MAAAEKALVVGFHFSFPSLGHVEKTGAGCAVAVPSGRALDVCG